ncbi:MAG: 50S ribosomal protein L29 [Mariprofundaceae bacterium]|nr:50S ribosomal protein L29 [Mariprofundaceae bacterium]
MKAVELRKMSAVELKERMDDLAAEHMKLRFQRATMQLTNSARIGAVRKEVARIQTILAQR